MPRRSPFLIGFAAWAMTWAAALAAPTPAPALPPSPLRAFTGHAHADFTILTAGSPIDLAARVTIAQRDALSRFDITIERGQVPLLPIGAITFVFDRSANTFTVWNATTKRYYLLPITPMLSPNASPAPSPSFTPAPGARPTPAPRSPLADLDVFALSVQLSGHSTVAGFATSGIVATIDLRRRGATATAHVHATADLADDFVWFPVDITATIDPAIPGVTGTFDYAIDDVARAEPPLGLFVVPPGFQKAATIFSVLSSGLPLPTPSSAPG